MLSPNAAKSMYIKKEQRQVKKKFCDRRQDLGCLRKAREGIGIPSEKSRSVLIL